MRHFISIDLRQWPTGKCAITLRDSDGHECVLDGLAHGAPHTHALVEIACDKKGHAVIEIPGHLCDYDTSNDKPGAKRKPCPAPRVKKDAKGNLLVTDETVPHVAILDTHNRLVGRRPLAPTPDLSGPTGNEKQPA